jgi:Spy/CpxP family protein refolding chaperone
MYLDKRNFILAASLIVSAGAAFPQAQPADSKPAEQHKRHGRDGQHMAEALNLTDAQKEQAKAIREKHRASSEDVRNQMRTFHEQLKAAKEANNTAEVQRLTQQREALFARVKETFTAQRNEFRSILTADQQAKFDQMREKHGDRQGKWRNRNHGGEKPQA